jgi:glycosyltransferase involved in cell wall biosynthesis
VVLEAVAEALVSNGHQVTVLCGKSSVTGEGAHAPPGDAALEMGKWGNLKIRKWGSLNPCDSSSSKVHVVRLWAPGWGKRKSALGKILSYAAYYLGVTAWLLRRRPRADVIVALTSPPYLSLLARIGAWCPPCHHAHWVMDLYPDVMVAHGMFKEQSLGYRVLGGLARWGMGGRRCWRVITLGPDMAERVQAWLSGSQKAVWVPLWGTAGESPAPEVVDALRNERGWGQDGTVFLYSGNMGLGHRFTEVLQAFPTVRAANPEHRMHLAYYGGGKRQEEIRAGVSQLQETSAEESPASDEPLKSRTPTHSSFQEPVTTSEEPGTPPPSTFNVQRSRFNVITSKFDSGVCPTSSAGTSNEEPETPPPSTFNVQRSMFNVNPSKAPPPTSLHPYVPHGLLAAHLAAGDVHLASLEPAWDGMMVPSKLQGIFAAGRPVLFTGSRTCSIGRWILESGAGWVCAPGDIEGHVQVMQEALDPVERRRRGQAALVFAAAHFNQQDNVNQIMGWLKAP